jgi:hypothetical protein
MFSRIEPSTGDLIFTPLLETTGSPRALHLDCLFVGGGFFEGPNGELEWHSVGDEWWKGKEPAEVDSKP